MKQFLTFLISLVSLFFIVQISVPAQEYSYSYSKYDRNQQISNNKFFVNQFFDDVSYLTTQSDFYIVMGAITAPPALLKKTFRTESAEFTEKWGSSVFADNLFESGEIVGQGAFPFAIAATSYGSGKLFNSKKLSSFGSDLFRAQAVNGLFTLLLKSSIDRPRPSGAPYSYPSGHTSSSFATAGVVYKHFGKKYGIPAFLLAGYVGLSRLQEGKHYITDVLAGSLLGSYISLKLSKNDTKGNSLSLYPSSSSNGLGISLSYKF